MAATIAAVAVLFSAYCLRSALRKYVGYNPTAPSLLTRISNSLRDPRPELDESHAKTRYEE